MNDHIPSTRLWGAAATAGDLSTWILILFFFFLQEENSGAICEQNPVLAPA